MISKAKMYIKLTLSANIILNVYPCCYPFFALTGGSLGSTTITQLASHFYKSHRFGRLDVAYVHKVLHKSALLDPTVRKVWRNFIYFPKRSTCSDSFSHRFLHRNMWYVLQPTRSVRSRSSWTLMFGYASFAASCFSHPQKSSMAENW